MTSRWRRREQFVRYCSLILSLLFALTVRHRSVESFSALPPRRFSTLKTTNQRYIVSRQSDVTQIRQPWKCRTVRLPVAVVGNDDEATRKVPSLAGPIFGVIKAMVGTGMLALPSGLAAVTNHPAGLWPAHALLVVFSILSGYTFLLYGRLTHATQATSLGDIWKKVHLQASACRSVESTKSSSGLIVSLVSFVFCFGACLTYSLVFGDLFSSVIRGTTSISSVLPAWALTRQASILAITSAVVFPLCNLSSLAALAPVSILGVLGTVVTTAFLAWRCPSVVSTSPYAVSGLGLLRSSSRQPFFSTYSRVDTPAPLILIAMSCVALMAHFSAPDFYHAMKTKPSQPVTDESQTPLLYASQANEGIMTRFRTVTLVGYSVVTILNSLTLAFGYLTFGGACDGIILNNYSSVDWGAKVARLLVGISVIGSYPFLMGATRSAALELFESGKAMTRAREFRMTSILLGLVTAISLVVKDAGFVLSFNGALMGSSIVYTIPALLFLKQLEGRLSSGILRTSRIIRAEQRICRMLVVFGVLSAIVGGTTTVVSSFFSHLLR